MTSIIVLIVIAALFFVGFRKLNASSEKAEREHKERIAAQRASNNAAKSWLKNNTKDTRSVRTAPKGWDAPSYTSYMSGEE